MSVFGQFEVAETEIFLRTKLSFGLVNLKPLVPGHVLICPHRRTLRFSELTPEEVADLWITAQQVRCATFMSIAHCIGLSPIFMSSGVLEDC